ncbi:hypothetical protein VE04_05108 [Pseudogymnoascus sp. 24MN13]|nr:hypothetical protein VE04_05108 [Pseudogymnoascus sp. 24MN13]
MDPLSVTAGAISIATFALQSCMAAHELVGRLTEAPKTIAHSKKLLSETHNTLEGLRDTLISGSESTFVLDSVLQNINLSIALKSTQSVCDEFGETIKGFTKHSTDLRFSSRDRLAVSFHESKISRFNQQLGECQSTISLALVSINLQVLRSMTLIISSRTSEDIQGLDGRFTAQETALVGLEKQLCDNQTALQAISLDNLGDDATDSWSAAERNLSIALTTKLRDVCRETLATTRAKHTGQSFGDMKVEKSMAYQGIVGAAQSGVEQSFGTLTATDSSTAAQGQMDASSFAMMFGRRR